MTADSGTKLTTLEALKPRINWFTTPITLEDHLVRIEELTDRILDHTRFIASIGGLEGSSGEAKQKAVRDFYTCLTTTDRALSRIGNDVRLG